MQSEREMCCKKSKIRFHFDWQDHWVSPITAEKEAKHIMHGSAGRMSGIQTFFNDLTLYNWLRSRKGCTKVDLIRVTCYHNEIFVFGLQATYRATMSHGVNQEMSADKHVFRSGTYNNMGGELEASTLHLTEDEYIKDVRTRQGEVVDQVCFVTNKRLVTYGGPGGVLEPARDYSSDIMSRVIAFTGTKAGALERLGYYLEPINWEAIKPLVLTRHLLETGRAQLKCGEQSGNGQEWSKDQTLTIMLLMHASDEIFQMVLSFNILPLTEKVDASYYPSNDVNIW